MTYSRFEDLPVWKAAMDFAVRIFTLVDHASFSGKGDLRNQLQRSALSVSQNIAEGFERGSTAEMLMFLYIARGTAGESRSALRFCQRLNLAGVSESELADLVALAETVSRQLRGWTDNLQNSDIPGQRHLTGRSREAWEGRRKTEAFIERLKRIQAGIPEPDGKDG